MAPVKGGHERALGELVKEYERASEKTPYPLWDTRAIPVHDQLCRFGSFPLNYVGPNAGQCDGKHHRIAWALIKAEGDIEFAGIL
jgi:hypothetical protein